MTTLREAAQMALDALELVDGYVRGKHEAKEALYETLAQPEQEPVAIHQFRTPYCADWYDGIPDQHDGHGPYQVRTLYAAPPQREWQGLTDEEMFSLWVKCPAETEDRFAFARAIEQALREKNT